MADGYFDLPQYHAAEFTTAVECLRDTPGFFPVHSGRLPEGVAQTEPPKVVFFGLDWGEQNRAQRCREMWANGRRPCRCQRFRRGDGRPGPHLTEGNLFEVLVEAHLDLKTVFLTNAVLGLAEVQTENTDQFRKHPKYLRACGAYHRRWLHVWKPRLAVLMGKTHLDVYGCSIWSVVWPELFAPGGVWSTMTELKAAFRSDRTVARSKSGMRVQLMHHPRSYTSPFIAPYREQTITDLTAIMA